MTRSAKSQPQRVCPWCEPVQAWSGTQACPNFLCFLACLLAFSLPSPSSPTSKGLCTPDIPVGPGRMFQQT